jgi:hypothetical protein
LKLKIPSLEQRSKIIEQAHNLGHFGIEATTQAIISKGFKWRFMRRDIQQHILSCQPCSFFNHGRIKYHSSKAITANSPFDHIEIDLIGPLEPSTNKFTYILDCVDVMTGMTLLAPLPNKEAISIANELFKLITTFGTPKIIQSDRGTEFVNNIISTLTSTYGIDHKLSAAYKPSTNGLVERKNRDVNSVLKKFCMGTYVNWDTFLPLVQLSINNIVSRRSKTKPFFLFFGRDFNGFEDFSQTEPLEITDDIVIKLLEHNQQFYSKVIPAFNTQIAEYKKKQQEMLDKQRIIIPSLPPNTKVMIKDLNPTSKWNPIFEGPWTVVKQDSQGNYQLKDKTGTIVQNTFPIEHLKIVDAEVLINHKQPIQTKDQEISFEIQEILDHRKDNQIVMNIWYIGKINQSYLLLGNLIQILMV